MENKTVITVKVIPGARRELVKYEEGQWKVYLNAPPIDGRANKALIKILAGHFGCRKRDIEITKGLQSRIKTININGKFSINPEGA